MADLDGDFTVEFFYRKEDKVDHADGWVKIPIKRSNHTFSVHSTEEVDGVLYHVVKRFEEGDNVPVSMTLTRADRVSGM